jgi:hypothetical protein
MCVGFVTRYAPFDTKGPAILRECDPGCVIFHFYPIFRKSDAQRGVSLGIVSNANISVEIGYIKPKIEPPQLLLTYGFRNEVEGDLFTNALFCCF